MRFVLHYRGPLHANGSVKEKHQIRQHVHAQLAQLWRQQPLTDYPELVKERTSPGNYSLLRPSFGFTFVPLVTKEMNAIAELSVTLLRPEAPGNLITQGGDIDNRLKTLFDALTMPRHEAQVQGISPVEDEKPFFYCLFEDDNLVTAISVRTEQLLESSDDKALVDLLVDVETRVTRPTMSNGFLG